MTMPRDSTPIQGLRVSAYTIPTETPEADGTYEWDSTTIVIAEVTAGGKQGLGYTYADSATAKLIEDKLKEIVVGCDAMSVQATWLAMLRSIRNRGNTFERHLFANSDVNQNLRVTNKAARQVSQGLSFVLHYAQQIESRDHAITGKTYAREDDVP